MRAPAISVIIPTFNRVQYVCAAVRSVVTQTHPATELFVVDDGSTDGTAAALAAFGDRIRYLHQENRGIGAARNTGVRQASSEFLAFLDDDDLWLPDKLERQVAMFDENPALQAVYGYAEQFICPDSDPQTRARLARTDGKVLPSPLASSLMIRRDAFDRVGPFSETLRIGVEVDWYSRLCDLGLATHMLEVAVVRRRLHASNINLTASHEQPERLHVLKQMIDRRRRAASAT